MATISCSALEAQQKEKEVETVTALASLSMVHSNQSVIECGFGSNLNPKSSSNGPPGPGNGYPVTTVALTAASDRGSPQR